MELSEAFSQIDAMGINSPKINPSEMTDEELARLRFTWVSPGEEKLVMTELRKRGLVL